jgi:hypothetical protein
MVGIKTIVVVNLNSDDYSDREIDIFQPIKSLHFEPNWPPLLMFLLRKILTSIDISLCPTMKKHPPTGTTTWDDASPTYAQKKGRHRWKEAQKNPDHVNDPAIHVNGQGVAVNDQKDVRTCNFGEKFFSRNDFFLGKLWKMRIAETIW